MAQKQTGKIAALLAALVVVLSAMLIGINVVTGPIIESNGASAAFAPLFAVMPDAENFEEVTATLSDVPASVIAVYKETSGKGYVVRAKASSQYSKDPMEMTFGVGADGKICGMQLDVYTESKDFGAGFPGTFVGQDSTLADVQIVAGCTYSSVAFKDAVAEGFAALIANELVGAGQKSDEQILMELLPGAHSGLVNESGVAQADDLGATGTYIVKAMKAKNNSGFAYLVKDGEKMMLAVVNATGSVKLLDVEGKDVAADHAAVVTEVVAHTAANIAKNEAKDLARMKALLADAEIKAINLPNSFNSVTSAYELTKDGKTYYGLVARSYGYNNNVMGVYYVLDEQGAIVKMTADELIFDAEYFHGYTLDEPTYKAGFAGLTSGSFTGDQALISGATLTSNAMKIATKDVFAAFDLLKGGAAQ